MLRNDNVIRIPSNIIKSIFLSVSTEDLSPVQQVLKDFLNDQMTIDRYPHLNSLVKQKRDTDESMAAIEFFDFLEKIHCDYLEKQRIEEIKEFIILLEKKLESYENDKVMQLRNFLESQQNQEKLNALLKTMEVKALQERINALEEKLKIIKVELSELYKRKEILELNIENNLMKLENALDNLVEQTTKIENGIEKVAIELNGKPSQIEIDFAKITKEFVERSKGKNIYEIDGIKQNVVLRNIKEGFEKVGKEISEEIGDATQQIKQVATEVLNHFDNFLERIPGYKDCKNFIGEIIKLQDEIKSVEDKINEKEQQRTEIESELLENRNELLDKHGVNIEEGLKPELDDDDDIELVSVYSSSTSTVVTPSPRSSRSPDPLLIRSRDLNNGYQAKPSNSTEKTVEQENKVEEAQIEASEYRSKLGR